MIQNEGCAQEEAAIGQTSFASLVAVKVFLLAGANLYQIHIGSPFISYHPCNKIPENTYVPGP